MVVVHQLLVQDHQHLPYLLVCLELEMLLVLQHWLGTEQIDHLDMDPVLMAAMEEDIQVCHSSIHYFWIMDVSY